MPDYPVRCAAHPRPLTTPSHCVVCATLSNPGERAPRRFVIKRHPLFTRCRACDGSGSFDTPAGRSIGACWTCSGDGRVPAAPISHPWALKDRARPAYVGQFADLAAALAAVSRRLKMEAGER